MKQIYSSLQSFFLPFLTNCDIVGIFSSIKGLQMYNNLLINQMFVKKNIMHSLQGIYI